MISRCAACNRRLPDEGACRCGVRAGVRAPDPRLFLSLEEHLGFGESDPIRPDAQLTVTFGGGPQLGEYAPLGTTLRRRFRRNLELEWSAPTFAADLAWNAVLILYYRGPLSEPPPGEVPPLASLRELRDGSVPLLEALLRAPPPELRTLEVHASANATRILERARDFPALEFLVVHFLEQDAGMVATDELLERHAWLDCRSLVPGTSTFALRR
ncbi:MAG: hypothetical protein QM817_32585 [Archangium sp.]